MGAQTDGYKFLLNLYYNTLLEFIKYLEIFDNCYRREF